MRIDVRRVTAALGGAALTFAFGAHLAAHVIGPTAPTRQTTISGFALDVSCAPLPGVTITVDGGGSAVTNGNGRFEITRSSGPAVLRARLGGFRSIERALGSATQASREIKVFLPAGPIEQAVTVSTDAQMVIGATPEPRYLRGRVRDSNCRPLADALVRRDDGEDVRRTRADGRFSFENVTSGTHRLEVTAPGFVRTIVEGLFFNSINTGDITVALDTGGTGERVVISPPGKTTAGD